MRYEGAHLEPKVNAFLHDEGRYLRNPEATLQLLTFAWGAERGCSPASGSGVCHSRQSGAGTEILLVDSHARANATGKGAVFMFIQHPLQTRSAPTPQQYKVSLISLGVLESSTVVHGKIIRSWE